jgi:hypothetical protein
MKLLQQGLFKGTGGRVDLDFAPDGVRACITIPQRRLRAGGQGPS